MSTMNSLYKMAIEALAVLEKPDYSNEDLELVFTTFDEVWGNENWLVWFVNEICHQSNGEVELVWALEREFEGISLPKGDHLLMKLVSEQKIQKLIFSRSSKPFKFV